MHRGRVSLLAVLLLVFGMPAIRATAQVDNASATNAQQGSNAAHGEQSGQAGSGDAVTGQVVGVSSAGDASVDATNHSEDVDATTGDVTGENSSAAFVGLSASSDTTVADLINGEAVNAQEGDNTIDVTQSAFVNSGDAVGGQVHGVTTAPNGTADLVFSNTSIAVDITTGDAEFNDTSTGLAGLFGPSEGEGGGGNSILLVNISDGSTTEGGVINFTLSLSRESRGKRLAAKATDVVTVTVQTSDGSADTDGKQDDYFSKTQTVTVPAGGTTVTVESNQDATTCEGSETFNFDIISATGAEVGDGHGVGTIEEAVCNP